MKARSSQLGSPVAPTPSRARRKPRRAGVQPQQLIEAHLKDPNFLATLLQHTPTASFLAETLKSRASQDEAFANLVVQACMPLTPMTQNAQTPHPTTPCKRSASSLKSRARSQTPGIRPGVVPRSLLPAFDESPGCPPKAARVERDQQEDCEVESFLDPLPVVLTAQVASFLKLSDKTCLLGSNRQARKLRQLPCTWQPLVLEAEDCDCILRRIRAWDPQGFLEPKFYPPPACAAWTQVTDVTVELMAADRIEHGEGLSHFRKASTMTKLILDPIQEFARRLSAGWFASASCLHLSNIEADCMDSGFLDFRLSAFRDFGELKLEQDGLDPNKYCLHACRSPSSLPSIGEGYAIVKDRFPSDLGISRLLNSPEDITESDALFLREHTLMLKTGHVFRSVHRPWHVIAESEIRERYDVLLSQLKQAPNAPETEGVIVV